MGDVEARHHGPNCWEHQPQQSRGSARYVDHRARYPHGAGRSDSRSQVPSTSSSPRTRSSTWRSRTGRSPLSGSSRDANVIAIVIAPCAQYTTQIFSRRGSIRRRLPGNVPLTSPDCWDHGHRHVSGRGNLVPHISAGRTSRAEVGGPLTLLPQLDVPSGRNVQGSP